MRLHLFFGNLWNRSKFYFSFRVRVLTVSFFLWCSLHGQSLESASFEIIGDEYKISNNNIGNIVQDTFGFLWICTMDGLNRFDGNLIKSFHHIKGDSTSLVDDSHQTIYIDKRGELWITYRVNVISKFDYKKQCFINYDFTNRPEFKKMRTGIAILHLDQDSVLWLGGFSAGLSALDLKTGNFREWNLPDLEKRFDAQDAKDNNTINCMYPRDGNSYWMGTYCGLYIFYQKENKFEHVSSNLRSSMVHYDFFNKISAEGDSLLWLASFGGAVFSYHIHKNTFREFRLPTIIKKKVVDVPVSFVQRKSANELWIIQSGRGLGVFNTKTGNAEFFKSELAAQSKFNLASVSTVHICNDGAIFAGCNEGLLKSNFMSQIFNFRYLNLPNTHYSNLFGWGSIIEDTLRQLLYIGTLYGNGLSVIDEKTGKIDNYEVDQDHIPVEKYSKVNDVILDHQNKVWLTSTYNVYKFDVEHKKLVKLIEPIGKRGKEANASIWNIEKDKDNDYWAVTSLGDLHQFFPEQETFSPPLATLKEYHNIPRGINRIRVNHDGTLWLGTTYNFALFDKKLKSAKLVLDSLQSNWLTKAKYTNMDNDPNGNLWVGILDRGLMKISLAGDSFNITYIDTSCGLPSAKVRYVYADSNGNIWIATLNGVFYYKPDLHQFRLFSRADGMYLNYKEIKIISDQAHTLYLTAPGMYAKVNFDLINKQIVQPKIYLSNFRVRNIERWDVVMNKSIVLKPHENFFSFEFGCIDFIYQPYDQFAYMLEGWDLDWVYCGSRRYASFNNLDHGDYVFKVKVAGPDGVWGEPLVIPLHIQTHFYKKEWFIVLTILVLSGVIFSLYRFRIAQVQKAERIKTDFNRQITELRMEALRAQMNPHFIFNCLNSINRYIIKSDVKTSSLYLTRFAKLIRLILDNSEYKKVVLSNELEALKLYIEMEALRFDHKFTYAIVVEPEVDADNIEIPPLIIQPYVENAIWHGLLHKESGGHLAVNVSCNEHELIFKITDNGIGRQKAMDFKSESAPTRKSLGMKLTQERLQLASENLEKTGSQKIIDLVDEVGHASGTQVIITIPI